MLFWILKIMKNTHLPQNIGSLRQKLLYIVYVTRLVSFSRGAPGLVDRMFTVHAGSRGFDSHRRHMFERFFRSNRPGYPHPLCSELEKSGIRVAVGDCSVIESRRWRPPYQIGKTKPNLSDHPL